jgi:hypothetical protein
MKGMSRPIIAHALEIFLNLTSWTIALANLEGEPVKGDPWKGFYRSKCSNLF